MNRFEPIHDAHAIEQVAVVVQFSAPIQDDTLFSRIMTAAEEFRDELPLGGPIQHPFQMLAGVGGFQIAVQPQVLAAPRAAGVTLSVTRQGSVVEEELRVDRMSITFRSGAYVSWKTLWAKVERYLEPLVPLYAETALIAAIGLTYLDKFYWQGDIPNVRVASLLREGSEYVAPHIFGVTDLWHSHTGAFVKVDGETKRLVNINLDSADENYNGSTRRVVTIATALTDMFNHPGYVQRAYSAAESASVCAKHLDMLHTYNKQVMQRTLNDEICKRIALAS